MAIALAKREANMIIALSHCYKLIKQIELIRVFG